MKKKNKKKFKKEKGAYWLVHRDYLIDLSLSRNPLGCSKVVKNTVNFKTLDTSRYPDSKEVIAAISSHFSIAKKNISLGAGIDDFINLFSQTLLKERDIVLMSKTTFPRFEMATRAFGGKPVLIPMKNMRIDFETFKKEAEKRKPKMVFIANPNNPTGLVEKKTKILNLARKVKASVIVDEAGIDFSGEKLSLVKAAGKLKNLVVLRSFSKSYGLSGLRIAFCVASPETLKEVQTKRPVFPVSSIAMKAAVVALSDQKHLKKTKELFKKETRFFADNLEKMGFQVLPPESNLIFAKVPPCLSSAQELIAALHEKDIHCVDGRFFAFPKYIRINPSTRKINKEFIEAVRQIIGGQNKR